MAVVCQPNNPTGEAVPPARLRAFGDRCREAVTELLVDEAFVATTRERVADEHERLGAAIAGQFDVRQLDAPFLLLDTGGVDVDALLAQARDRGSYFATPGASASWTATSVSA